MSIKHIVKLKKLKFEICFYTRDKEGGTMVKCDTLWQTGGESKIL